ncbi:MAG: four helix bundle protein [Kiritimatiellaeota bacterium]|nr:four helix bundle protein [Kiritimatiellota bacterium]
MICNPAHFVSKLSDSAGEIEETIHWLETAFACEYVTEEVKEEIVLKCHHIGGMLNKMMGAADSWCKNYIDDK